MVRGLGLDMDRSSQVDIAIFDGTKLKPSCFVQWMSRMMRFCPWFIGL